MGWRHRFTRTANRWRHRHLTRSPDSLTGIKEHALPTDGGSADFPDSAAVCVCVCTCVCTCVRVGALTSHWNTPPVLSKFKHTNSTTSVFCLWKLLEKWGCPGCEPQMLLMSWACRPSPR